MTSRSFAAILFDLDGTLLEVDMQSFIPAYLRRLAGRFAPDVEPDRFQTTVRAAIHALLGPRDDNLTNEQLFLQALERHLGLDAQRFATTYRQWLQTDVESLRPLVRSHPLAGTLLEEAFAKNCRVVIATNPVFPRGLIEARLRWGGLEHYPFELVTAYENCRFCKPNPDYYHDILRRLELESRQCLMVGNDNHHDLAAAQAGIPTFLLDTWLIDRGGETPTPDYRGDHRQLLDFLRRLEPSA